MKLRTKLFLIQIFSMIILGCSIIGISLWIQIDEFYYRTEETLKISVSGYNDDVNYLKDSMGIDITIFEGDTRIDSSIQGSIGTKASDEVIKVVIEDKKPYFSRDVDVNGVSYCGYYEPTETGMIFAGQEKSSLTKLINSIVTVLTIISAIIIGICLFSSAITVKFILKKLSEAQKNIEILANGDLKQDIVTYENTKDEAKLICNDTYKLQQSLINIVSDIKRNTIELHNSNNAFKTNFNDIVESISNINVAVEEIAQGATQQADDTQTAAGEIDVLSNIADKNTDDVSNLDRSSTNMTKAFDKVNESLSQTSLKAKNINEKLEIVQTKNTETNEAISKIKEAVELIKDITSQTNLLSLNASIEAAHAGDSGKGFAVVAEEIRKLSDNCAKGTAVIEEIVKEILNKSCENRNEITSTVELMNQQNKLFQELNNQFEILKENVISVDNVSKNISDGNTKIIQSKNSLVNVVSELSAISEENAASCEETSASIEMINRNIDDCSSELERLNNLGLSLKNSVEQFQID